ncbi:MAG: acyltransferase [Acidiferrobacterales bacterium]|nr:acyltransferase [Acidiferrobacterales bacterium]
MRKVFKFVFGDAWGSGELSVSHLVKCLFIQKILGINRNVDWPVHWTTKVKSPKNIQRGSRFPGISPGCYFDGRNGIEIANNVWIGPGVKLISMNHELNNYSNYVETKPIRIGKDCWLGADVIVLAGVELGPHTIVGAGAVVTKSFPEGNALIGGNPAKEIKALPEYH